MKWLGRRQSDNVEDRRGVSGGKVALGGGVIGIIILLLNVFGGETGQVVGSALEQMQGGQQQTEAVARIGVLVLELDEIVSAARAKLFLHGRAERVSRCAERAGLTGPATQRTLLWRNALVVSRRDREQGVKDPLKRT